MKSWLACSGVLVCALVAPLGAAGAPTTTAESADAADAPGRGPWEARLVMGYHQAGAASSKLTQNVAIDFYVVRSLTKSDLVWRSRWNTWGNVRIASVPRQLNVPFVDLAGSLLDPAPGGGPAGTHVNELALAGEFQTGMELNLTRGPEWKGKEHGVIAWFGATGAFEAADQTVRLYQAPAAGSPQWALFHDRFPTVPASTSAAPQYLGLVVPDRERFYRQWGMGYRYSRFHPKAAYEAPQTFAATIGQDEAITGGSFGTPVLRVDAFYPLPVAQANGRFQFLYLFATAAFRLSKGGDS